jgi:hypothetical protein
MKMSHFRNSLIAILGCLLIGSAGAASAGKPGAEIGKTAPSCTLVDQAGAERSLTSLLGRGKLAVVFFRSADW